MKKLSYFVLLLSLIVLGCSESKEGMKVEYHTISNGVLLGAGGEGIEQGNLIIDNWNEWSELLVKLDAVNNVSDSFLVSKEEFDNSILIAVFDEVRSTGGYSLELEVKQYEHEIMVSVMNLSPDGMVTQAICQPYSIIQIEKSDHSIVFQNIN